ncbi:hypothetical protein WJX72_008485 [[Myrmecia] bisecta]|uniref:Ubiquinone biosynthesis protein COQ4 homolog, mitochondrial n=1 Tax=[Myrmecia] bisecta TaxID=41462 RepID=A0AAW1Q3Y9_9CHLO
MWVLRSCKRGRGCRVPSVQQIGACAQGDALVSHTTCNEHRAHQHRHASTSGTSYPTHLPLNFLQRGAVAVLSAIGAVANPARADLVAALGETTGELALRNMRLRMQSSPTGRRILQDQPRVTDATLEYARTMPEGTFGHAYAMFMGDRNFTAGERPPVRFIDDPELAYVAARAREVHDFWHVLFGCHTNVFGELALKAVEFVQTGMPMTALSVLGAQWRLKPEQRARLLSEYVPWALRAGARSADLMSLYYEEHFQDDLVELRRKWRIMPAPRVPRRLIVDAPAVPVQPLPT